MLKFTYMVCFLSEMTTLHIPTRSWGGLGIQEEQFFGMVVLDLWKRFVSNNKHPDPRNLWMYPSNVVHVYFVYKW